VDRESCEAVGCRIKKNQILLAFYLLFTYHRLSRR